MLMQPFMQAVFLSPLRSVTSRMESVHGVYLKPRDWEGRRGAELTTVRRDSG